MTNVTRHKLIRNMNFLYLINSVKFKNDNKYQQNKIIQTKFIKYYRENGMVLFEI